MRESLRHGHSRRGVVLTLAAITCCTSGCASRGSGGALTARSSGDSALVLPSRYLVGYFSHDDRTGTSILLSDAPVDDVLKGQVTNAQMLHVELLWIPKPGATPMASSAVNASIRHIIVAEGEVGIYGGAGFALPGASPESRTLPITLREAALQLLDHTEGFVDRLSPAHMSGSFTAINDEKKARQLHYAISQLVTNKLGRTRIVDAAGARGIFPDR